MRSARERRRPQRRLAAAPPALHALEQRPAPEHAEQDERDDEDDRRGREEERTRGPGGRERPRSRARVGVTAWTVKLRDLDAAILELDLEAPGEGRPERGSAPCLPAATSRERS